MLRFAPTSLGFLLAGLALGVAPAIAAAAPLPPGTQEIDFDFAGHRRFFLMHVPPQAAPGRPLPVVISFHGGGGEPHGHESWTGMDAVADREGFVVLYPAGYSRQGNPGRSLLTWNAGNCCGPAQDDGSDDVGFVRHLLIEANARAPLDRTRVYATGMSNGAMMAYRVAREMSSQIAAIAPVAGASDPPIPADALPVPVLHFHSVDDPRALFAGGEGPPFPFTDRRVLHPAVEAVVAAWAAHDGCPPVPVAEAPRTSAAGHTATRLTYGPCASGAPVALWKMTGPGHVWPGTPQKRALALLGAATDVLDANTEIWAFFRQFQRPNAPDVSPLAATPRPAEDASGESTFKRAPHDGSAPYAVPFSRSVLALRAAGARDRFKDDGSAVSAAALSLQARTTLFGRATVASDGLRLSALSIGVDGRALTSDFPSLPDDHRFYRLGASVSGFLVTPRPRVFYAQIGAFVAEEGRLLHDPKLRVYGLGLGTTPLGAHTQVLYGLGYVYDFGRGLPLPFLGADWRFTPAWRLEVLLPLLARVSWRVSQPILLTLGAHVAGDLFRYQTTDAASGDQVIRELRIARLRAGAGARVALTAHVRFDAEVGLEGAHLQDGVTSGRASGGYLLGALVIGKNNDSRELELVAD